MGKGNDPNCAAWATPMPDPLEGSDWPAGAAAAQWFEMVADEYRLWTSLFDGDQRRTLQDSTLRLLDLLPQLAIATHLSSSDVDFLQEVALQLALWDCDPARPNGGTWLSLAADDISRLVTDQRTAHR